MGLQGAVVLYLKSSKSVASEVDRQLYASAIVTTFVELGLVDTSVLPDLVPDKEFTFATGGVESSECELSHFAIEPSKLTRAIGDLVYFDTAKVWWGEQDKVKGALLAVPYMDISIFSTAVPFKDADGSVLFESAIIIEFSYEDARLSEEVHRVRNQDHPLFDRLRNILGADIGWSVVSG